MIVSFSASLGLLYPHGLPEPDILSIRRAVLSHPLLQFQDQPYPEAAQFFFMPFAKGGCWSLQPREAGPHFPLLQPSPTPYHPISGILLG